MKTRLEQIEDIYQAVIDQPPEKRRAFLQTSCGDDGELRREIESLLRYDDSNFNFIDSPPAALAAEMFSDDEKRPTLEGSQVGLYKIERLLGEGGMGEVYLAEDTRLHRQVALKVLPNRLVADAERLMRFEREAHAASALNHPNILTIHEFGEADGIHFLAGEFVDGLTLGNMLAGGRLNITEALDIAIQVASALAAAHDAGITHRDIKPENIMIRRDGYVKVLDFGLAKLAQQRSGSGNSGSEDPTMNLHQTKPGAVMGTAAYMSPEQARGIHVEARTDIWSLGVVLYEMLAGVKPFVGETPADTIVAVLSVEPAPVFSHAPDLPSELGPLLSRALSKNVEDRYRSAKELRADLEKIRKRIELGESLRSDQSQYEPEYVGREISATVKDGVRTNDDGGRATDGGKDGLQDGISFWSSPSLGEVFRQARTRRATLAIFAIALVAVISAAAYFGLIAPTRTARIDSIAVLPFENTSGDPDLAYISDGISESLIDRLSQIPQLKVIARNSSFKFRGDNVDVREAALQMGVRVIVSGRIAKVGDELTVRVDIMDAAENRQIGGGEYRRRTDNLLSIQKEIAQTTSANLGLELTNSQSRRLLKDVTEDSEAYRYYLSGLVELNGPQDVRSRALEYFEHAVKLDPDFASAYTEIAWVNWSLANGSDDPNELMPKVKAATERALTIDPDHAKAHVLQAMVKEYEFDWRSAESEYERAIELSPNLDFARNNYAFFLSVMGRQDEALAELEQQRLRDPINQRLGLLHKAFVLTQARRFDDALDAYREAQALEPAKDIPHFSLAYAYAGKGLYNEAAGYYKRSVDLLGGEEKYSQPLVYLAATYAKIPANQTEAGVILKRIEATSRYASPALLAAGYSALGDNDKAMELLEQAYIKRDILLRFIGTGYEYDGLRNDPRFKDLLRRMGMLNQNI